MNLKLRKFDINHMEYYYYILTMDYNKQYNHYFQNTLYINI